MYYFVNNGEDISTFYNLCRILLLFYDNKLFLNYRYMTILFYLNDVEDGGDTAFPVANNETVSIQVHPFICQNINLSKYNFNVIVN